MIRDNSFFEGSIDCLVRGISMGELTERDDDIIRVPELCDHDWQRFYGKIF